MSFTTIIEPRYNEVANIRTLDDGLAIVEGTAEQEFDFVRVDQSSADEAHIAAHTHSSFLGGR